MSKKLFLLALAAASFGLFALPVAASAEEIHIDTATSFTGSGVGGSLVTEAEPTITCEIVDVNNGVITPGGTTGSMSLDFTGCHASVFGLTAKCHTTGSALDNTIASGGTIHLITWKNSSGTAFPAVLVTAVTTEIICAGISTTHVEGNLIGTITSPKCGETSNKLSLSFSATGPVQNHILYTNNPYDLISRTGGGGGTPKTAGLNASPTITMNTSGKLTCT